MAAPRTPTLERHHSVVMLDGEDAMRIVKADLANLRLHAPSEIKSELDFNLNGFQDLFERFLIDRRIGNVIVWDKIQPLPAGAVKPYSSISPVGDSVAKSLLDKLVVLKLNGGLGTSMGCVGPKSLISVRNDANFLDLNVQQIEDMNRRYNSNVPLVLMNSFNTHADTERIKHKYERRVDLHMFQQSFYPRVLKETLRPYPETVNLQDGW